MMSEMPIIPSIHLTNFDEQYADVHLSLASDSEEASGSAGLPIAGYKVPILFSCAHRKVKVVKGRAKLK